MEDNGVEKVSSASVHYLFLVSERSETKKTLRNPNILVFQLSSQLVSAVDEGEALVERLRSRLDQIAAVQIESRPKK